MSKLSTLLLLLAALTIGCESDTGPGNTPATLIPLTEGNLWIYENSIYDTLRILESRTYDTITIGKAVAIDGETWHQWFSRPLRNPNVDSIYYASKADGVWSRHVVSVGPSYRITAGFVYKYPTAANDTFLLKFAESFPPDETIEKSFSMTASTNGQVVVPAGTFSTVHYQRFLQNVDSVTKEVKRGGVLMDQYVAPGVGLVKATSGFATTGGPPDSLQMIRHEHETILISYSLK